MSKFNPEDYRPVQERINQFHTEHPDGSITTEVISDPNNPNLVVVKATIYPTLNDRPVFSDHAIEVAGSSPRDGANYGFHVENACTSAIGRALADMGYATSALDRPSREEMEKVNRIHDAESVTRRSSPVPSGGGEPLMSPAQERLLGMLMTRNDIDPATAFAALSDDEGTTLITKREASAWIDFMDQKRGVPHDLAGFVNR